MDRSTLQDIPTWHDVPDHFVWDAFDRATDDPARRLVDDTALQQEALLAETEHLYVIPDQFGIVDGHVLIIPKQEHTSFAALDTDLNDEVAWCIAHVAAIVARAYDAHSVLAEHGECGCATAGQAHIHVIPVPASVTPVQFEATVDRVLERRAIGIERIVYKGTEFTSPEDIRELRDRPDAAVVGEFLRARDLVREVRFPADARSVSGLQQPYVWLRGPGVELLSTRSFRSQFAREIVASLLHYPDGAWDRFEHTSRANMFATHERLAPAFRVGAPMEFGFRPRSGAW